MRILWILGVSDRRLRTNAMILKPLFSQDYSRKCIYWRK